MLSNKKSEYIPLLESDHHIYRGSSDCSSSFVKGTSNYGTSPENEQDNKASIESIYGESDEVMKQVFGDFNTVTLTWCNINCYAPNGNKGMFGNIKDTGLFKQLLFNVNGVVSNGSLMAIMGASGAGKSTLLNVLTCRNLGNIKVDGEVKVNGIKMDSNIKKVSAYVQQLDVFYGRLKVREHLLYHAVLRMGSKWVKADKIERIETLISDLGLSSCEGDYINCNSYHSQGLAGSEKKLLSIACELLCDPPIIFLDEPTTGLDSKMAEKVLRILQTLSRNGKCIICTIHQPSSLIYEMFNETYLLAEGRLIFQGNRQNALLFFSEYGFPCADNFNPADHFIHVLAIRPGLEHDCRAKVIYLSRKFQDTSEYGFIKKEILAANNIAADISNKGINRKLKSMPIYKASYWQEIKIQTWKQFLDLVRDSKLFLSRIIQNFICTIFLTLIVLRQKYDQVGVNNINGAIFSIINNMSFLAIVQYSSFNKELRHFNSEHQNGMCRSGSFFIAKSISDMPLFMITVSMAVVISYWAIGLYPRVEEFFVFYLILLLIYQFSFSLNVLLIGSLVNNLNVGLTVSALTVNIMMLMSGYLVNDSTIPIYFKWLKYISCQRFGFEILTINQWKNVDKIECKMSLKESCYNSGADVIKFLSFLPSNVLFDVILMVGMIILFKIVSLLIIIIKVRERKLN